MPGIFADTTLVVEIIENGKATDATFQGFVLSNQPAHSPEYALREFIAGRLQIVCAAHNGLLAVDSVAEAIVAITNVAGFAARTNIAKIQQLAAAMLRAMSGGVSKTDAEAKREVLQYLSTQVIKMWMKAKTPQPLSYVQQLSCRPLGDPDFDQNGALRGPGGTFNCETSSRCSAAQYLYQQYTELSKLIDALHPEALDESARHKKENQTRRKALKDLKQNGPIKFDKRGCRALGDAYFAAMCPAGSQVVTTNISDHALLCAAVGKQAIRPP